MEWARGMPLIITDTHSREREHKAQTKSAGIGCLEAPYDQSSKFRCCHRFYLCFLLISFFLFFSFLFWYFGSSAYLFHHCLSCFQSFVLSLHLSFNWRGKALLSCVSEDLAEPEWGGSSLSVSPLRWAGFLHRTGIKNDFQLSSHLVHWKDTKTTFGVTNWMLMVSISLSILYKAC